MKLVKAIVRPSRFDAVKEALNNAGFSGMTVSDVRGCGKQKGHKAIYRGNEYYVNLLNKTKIEMVVKDDQADQVVAIIIDTARTGEIGDGKIFVGPVFEEYTIRTGERDAE